MMTWQEKTGAFKELGKSVYAALETYSNVHRGSGYKSTVTTHLYEQARDIILDYLGLNKSRYVVVFSTPRTTKALVSRLKPESYHIVSSQDIGLSIGVRAIAIKKRFMPKGTPFHTGGGTTRLISKDWLIWAKGPDKFEAGTPAIVNVIAFAKALLLMQKYGNNIFFDSRVKNLKVNEILYNDELADYSGQELFNEFKKTIIGGNIKVPTLEGSKLFINMDCSASTPTFTPIWDTFRQTWSQTDQVQKKIIPEVKSICAKLLGAPQAKYDILFTSNTTEAINLTAESLSLTCNNEEIEPVVLNTIMEHSSNDLPWRMIPNNTLIRLSVDAAGFVDLNELETLLDKYNNKGEFGKKRIKLVAMSGASNVLGVCNNIAEISTIVHQFGAQLQVDAAQLVAHRKIDMEESGVDFLAFSAHKVYAPFGCGVLVVRKGLLRFSDSEMVSIQSSGEENIAGIAGLGKALELLQRIGMNLIHKEEEALTTRALQAMSQLQGLKIHGIETDNHPGFDRKLGVIAFELQGMMGDRVASALNMQSGIGVRYGCHCAHIIVKHILNISQGLERFQRLLLTLFPKLSLPGLVRVSFGIENSEEDIVSLEQALNKIINLPKNSSHNVKTVSPVLPKAEVQKQVRKLVHASSLRVYS